MCPICQRYWDSSQHRGLIFDKPTRNVQQHLQSWTQTNNAQMQLRSHGNQVPRTNNHTNRSETTERKRAKLPRENQISKIKKDSPTIPWVP